MLARPGVEAGACWVAQGERSWHITQGRQPCSTPGQSHAGYDSAPLVSQQQRLASLRCSAERRRCTCCGGRRACTLHGARAVAGSVTIWAVPPSGAWAVARQSCGRHPSTRRQACCPAVISALLVQTCARFCPIKPRFILPAALGRPARRAAHAVHSRAAFFSFMQMMHSSSSSSSTRELAEAEALMLPDSDCGQGKGRQHVRRRRREHSGQGAALPCRASAKGFAAQWGSAGRSPPAVHLHRHPGPQSLGARIHCRRRASHVLMPCTQNHLQTHVQGWDCPLTWVPWVYACGMAGASHLTAEAALPAGGGGGWWAVRCATAACCRRSQAWYWGVPYGGAAPAGGAMGGGTKPGGGTTPGGGA